MPHETTSNRRAPAGEPSTPRTQIAKGKAIFSDMGMDVSHFGAIWHIHKIAQLMETDLNRISRKYGLSIADFHLLGAIMIEQPHPATAAKLAAALNVSTAALSVRVSRLTIAGHLTQQNAPKDRRIKHLHVTEAGQNAVTAIGLDLQNTGRFAHHIRKFSADDRARLDSLLADLHTMLNRDFLPTAR
jgi:DNA-binding MarR family transcriptional regulator